MAAFEPGHSRVHCPRERRRPDPARRHGRAEADRLPEGLTASYFADANWSTTRPSIRIDPQPSRDSLVDAWQGRPPQTFSTTWLGSLAVLRRGTYCLLDHLRRWLVGHALTAGSSSTTARPPCHAQQATAPHRSRAGRCTEIHIKRLQGRRRSRASICGGRAAGRRSSRSRVVAKAVSPGAFGSGRQLSHTRCSPRTIRGAVGADGRVPGSVPVLAIRRPVAAAVAEDQVTDRTPAAAAGIITVSCVINVVGIPWPAEFLGGRRDRP